jgi:hypothetical protein
MRVYGARKISSPLAAFAAGVLIVLLSGIWAIQAQQLTDFYGTWRSKSPPGQGYEIFKFGPLNEQKRGHLEYWSYEPGDRVEGGGVGQYWFETNPLIAETQTLRTTFMGQDGRPRELPAFIVMRSTHDELALAPASARQQIRDYVRVAP